MIDWFEHLHRCAAPFINIFEWIRLVSTTVTNEIGVRFQTLGRFMQIHNLEFRILKFRVLWVKCLDNILNWHRTNWMVWKSISLWLFCLSIDGIIPRTLHYYYILSLRSKYKIHVCNNNDMYKLVFDHISRTRCTERYKPFRSTECIDEW